MGARTAYWRKYKRAQRARRHAEAQRSAHACPFRFGRATCGWPLRDVVDRLGRVTVVCDACDRRRAGICRDCPRPVHGKRGWALRCAEHRRARREATAARWFATHLKEKRASCRRYMREIRAGLRLKGLLPRRGAERPSVEVAA